MTTATPAMGGRTDWRSGDSWRRLFREKPVIPLIVLLVALIVVLQVVQPGTVGPTWAAAQIRFAVPQLSLAQSTAAIAVRVVRAGSVARLNAAMVVQPRLVLEELQPQTGPPQGGNIVDLFGRGFHYGMRASFDGAPAADLRVLGRYDWRLADGNVWKVERLLFEIPHRAIRSSPERVARLRKKYFAFLAAFPGRKPIYYDRRTWTALPAAFGRAGPR